MGEVGDGDEGEHLDEQVDRIGESPYCTPEINLNTAY